jgi:hypothetical protein
MLRVVFCALFIASAVTAHTPVLDMNSKSVSAPYVIDDAEHSKAIFSALDGDPDFYKLVEGQPFDFYVGITAAKIEGCALKSQFSFDVYDSSMKLLDKRDGSKFEWWAWYEKWGKKWYWVGPQIGADFKSTDQYSAGTYYIKVYNKDNKGKYVLAVGDDERFGIGTMLKLRGIMKETSEIFWESEGC